MEEGRSCRERWPSVVGRIGFCAAALLAAPIASGAALATAGAAVAGAPRVRLVAPAVINNHRAFTYSATIAYGEGFTASAATRLKAVLPPGLHFRATWPGAPFQCRAERDIIDCVRNNAFPTGNFDIVNFDVEVTAPGVYSFALQVGPDHEGRQIWSNRAMTRVTQSQLEASVAVPPKVHAGEIFDYRLTIRNVGSSTTGTVELAIGMPAGLALIGGQSEGGFVCSVSDGGGLCTRRATLPPQSDDTVVLRFQARNAGHFEPRLTLDGGGMPAAVEVASQPIAVSIE